jgi:hypothetical protein
MTARARELGVVRVLVGVAVAVSVVHYADNTLNYAAYPQPSSGAAPSQLTVGLSWPAFTAVAVAAYLLLRRGRTLAAAFGLAVYSGSGLVGIGHYTVPGATGMPWWRQAHIVADITCGVALLACALWLTRRARAPIREQPAR